MPLAHPVPLPHRKDRGTKTLELMQRRMDDGFRHLIAEIAQLRTEMRTEISDLRKEMITNLCWLMGIQITTVIAVMGMLAKMANFF